MERMIRGGGSRLKESETSEVSDCRPSSLTRTLGVLVLLSLVGLLIYSNTFSAAFHFDDYTNIEKNPQIQDLKNLSDASGSRYIGFLTFALNYYFGGLNVFGYHLVNLIIHLVNAFLVYFLVLFIFETPAMASSEIKNNRPFGIALAASLFFVSHPVQTQAVTYIVQRFASLATLFYLLTLVCYLRWRLTPSATRGRSFLYIAALMSIVLGMKTKEITFTLPIMIIMIEAVFFSSGGFVKRWLFIAPFLLSFLIIPLSRPDVVGQMEAGFARQTLEISRFDYLFTQFRVIVTYLRLLVLPINQQLDYDYPVYHSFFEFSVLLSFLFLSALFVLALYSLFKRSQSPYTRLIAFGTLWFFLALSIESSIIPIIDVIFEHRLYLPSIGFFIAFSTVLITTVEQRAKSAPDTYKVVGLAILIIVLGFGTYQRNLIWKDDLIFWQYEVKRSPNKARVHHNLGLALQKKGMVQEAIVAFEKALTLKPDFPEPLNNLGVIYTDQGHWDKAIEVYEKALKLNPNLAESHHNLAGVYAIQGRWDAAIREYQTALKLKPDFPEVYDSLGKAHLSYGNAFMSQGHWDEAIQQYFAALKTEPDRSDIYNNLGVAYESKGMLDEAIQAFQKAIQLKPDYARAYFNLGNIQVSKRRWSDAIQSYEKAIELRSDFKEARDNLDQISKIQLIRTGKSINGP